MSQTLGINNRKVSEQAAALEDRLRGIGSAAQACSIWRPIHTYSSTVRLTGELMALRSDFESALKDLVTVMNAPIAGPGFATGPVATAVVGAAMMHYLRLQQAWSDASAAIDRQGAYSLGTLGLYVALVALIITVVFGLLSIRQVAA